MKLTKIEKIATILEQIKIIDAQIVQIDQFAQQAANDKIKALFELKVENIQPEKKDDDLSLVIDAVENIKKAMEGMLNNGHHHYHRFHPGVVAEKENYKILNSELSETATLQILGILLGEKQTQRKKLVSELKELGISI